MTERLVNDPVLRQRYIFRSSVAPDGTTVMEIEMWVDPGGGVTPHVHPFMEERFTVLSGEPEVLSGRRWETFTAGQCAVVPPHTRHAFRNRGAETAHFRVEVRQPEGLQGFLEDVAALSRAGHIMRPGLPRTLTGLLGTAVIAQHYRDTSILLVPPPFVQKLLLDPLAGIGRRRGFRPGAMAAALET
jgi:quercetin dioxygenase-like cupin family protein